MRDNVVKKITCHFYKILSTYFIFKKDSFDSGNSNKLDKKNKKNGKVINQRDCKFEIKQIFSTTNEINLIICVHSLGAAIN